MNRIGINNVSQEDVDEAIVELAVRNFLDYFKIDDKEVSVALIDDGTMKELNRDYRGIDSSTDVLSFTGEGDDLGEVILSPAKLRAQAIETGRNYEDELIFILIHGLLHLLGHNDETEEERLDMIALGEKVVAKIKEKI